MSRQIDYIGKKTGVVARRTLGPAIAVAEQLRGYGFICTVERHCKFWLVQWTFPRLAAPITNNAH